MDNIKLDLLEIGLNVVDWIGLAQDRYSSCKLCNEPLGSIKCWELPNGCTTCGLSSGTHLHKLVRNEDGWSNDDSSYLALRLNEQHLCFTFKEWNIHKNKCFLVVSKIKFVVHNVTQL
jgi:hypothetical protein